MSTRALLLLAFLSFTVAGTAAEPTVIPSSSRQFLIIDNGDQREAELVDGLLLDTYAYHPGKGPKEILIQTDRARQLFRFATGERVDFAIEYGGRRYHQRLALVEPHQWVGPDEVVLPFALNSNHGVIVDASINGSRPIKLLFDTGASVSVLSKQAEKVGAKLAGPTGSIRLGPIEVRDTPIISIPYAGGLKAGGVLGYNVFLGRQVTIDYGRRQLRISAPGSVPPGFRTVPLYWLGSRTMLDIGVRDGTGERRVPVLLDTGSRFSLSLSSKDPLAANLGGLKELGWQSGRSSNGDVIESRVFVMPEVALAGFRIREVQAHAQRPGQSDELPVHILGNDFLKRFDLIIDYQSDLLHLRPNGLLNAPYNGVSRFSRPTNLVLSATGVSGLLVAISLWWRSRKRRIQAT